MANQFKVGDVVQLKSGGPKMTVSESYNDGTLGCVWFLGSDQKAGTFPSDALELAPPAPEGRSQVGGKGGPWS